MRRGTQLKHSRSATKAWMDVVKIRKEWRYNIRPGTNTLEAATWYSLRVGECVATGK